MKEKWNELTDLFEERGFTMAEVILTILVTFLTGLVIGIFASPKKHIMIGSNNGNNSGNDNSNNLEDLFDEIEEIEEIDLDDDDEECGFSED